MCRTGTASFCDSICGKLDSTALTRTRFSDFGFAEQFLDASHVLGNIHTDRIVRRFGDANLVAILHPAKLLELFDAFQVSQRQRGKIQQRGPPERVQSEMFQVARVYRRFAVTNPGNGGAREI